MNEKSFSIRRFAMSDVNDVVQLLKLAFKKEVSSEWWNWKYKLNPAGFWGELGDIWIAENMNQVVGHLGIIPEKIKVGSRTAIAGQVVDVANHPDYRGLGIFLNVAKKMMSAQEAQKRYDVLYAFPNELSCKHWVPKLGWKMFRIVEFLKFLDYDRPLKSILAHTRTSNFISWSGKTALRAIRIARSISPSLLLKKFAGDPVEIKEVDKFPSEIDNFWELVRSEYETVLERTSAFLNWRFSKHFGNYRIYIARSIEKGGIVGYLVWKKPEIQNVLNIIDLQALPGEDKCVLDLVDMAIKVSKEEGLDLIHCRIPTWHKYAKILYKLGFISVGRTLEWMKTYQYRLCTYPIPGKPRISRMQKWFYTFADTDDM